MCLLAAAAIRAVRSVALDGRALLGALCGAAGFGVRLFHSITSYDYLVQGERSHTKEQNFPFAFPCIPRSFAAHTLTMKKEKKTTDTNPTDRMIQANKDEAESTLRLWGLKERKHLHPKKGVWK